MNSRQSAESDEFKIFGKKVKNLLRTGKITNMVFSAPEISPNAPIKIESESK